MNYIEDATDTRNGLVALEMQTFGVLVSQLRDRRGITQKQLADMVGVDPNTIARAEQDKGSWYRRTSLAVFEALGRVLPLSTDEAAQYLEAAGLAPELARPPFVRSRIEADIAAEDAGLPVAADTTSRDMRDTHRLGQADALMERLAATVGAARAIALLAAITDVLAPQRPATPERHDATPIREFTMIGRAKVPFPGAIERVHETIRVPKSPPAQAAPKPKARKRSG